MLLRLFSRPGWSLLVAIVSVLCLWLAIVAQGELADKKGYAILQELEFNHRRDTPDLQLHLLKNASASGYDVLGIPVKDDINHWAWLLLNKTDHKDRIMMIPQEFPLLLHCDELVAIYSNNNVNERVIEFLNMSCSK